MQAADRRAPNRSARYGLLIAVFAVLLSACSAFSDSTENGESPTSGPGISLGDTNQPRTTEEDAAWWLEVLPDQQLQTSYPAGKYVSPSGNNANGGTSPTDAWKTVAYAVNQLNAGDTLFLMDGTYNESGRSDAAVPINRQGRADAWIRITAFPGAKPKITSWNSSGMQFENGAQYVEVSGIEFAGNPDPNYVNGRWPGAGIVIFVDAHHIRVYNNTIHSYGAGGIVGYKGSHADVRNNVVYENAKLDWNQHSGISFFEFHNVGFGDDAAGYSNYVMGNLVYRNENLNPDPSGNISDGNCVILDRFNVSGYTGRTLVANNICIDNGGRSLNMFMSSHVDVFNNTAYHNLRSSQIGSTGGEMLTYQSTDVNFANNLIYTRPGVKPIVSWESSGVNYTNNMFVGDQNPGYSSSDFYLPSGSVVVAAAGLEPTAANFDLPTGSPAISKGTADIPGPVKTDFGGRQRSQGAAPDIGAFEAREGGSVTPAPTTTTSPPTTAPPTTAGPTTTSPAGPTTTTPSGPPEETTATTRAPTGGASPPSNPPTSNNDSPSTTGAGGDEQGTEEALGAPSTESAPSTTAPTLESGNLLAPTTTGPPPSPTPGDPNASDAIGSSPVVTTDSGSVAQPDLAYVAVGSESNGSGFAIALSLIFLVSGFGVMQLTIAAPQRRN